EHDDGGVDDHAYTERQPSERHRVQREAAEVEQRERADDGDGNRRADDERRAEVAQEREDDQDDENAADEGVLLDVVDRALDEDRAVVEHDEADAGDVAVDAGHLRANGLSHGDRVLAGLLVDLHADGGMSFAELPARIARRDAEELTAVFGRIRDVGDVLQVDGDVLPREDDEVADVVDVDELTLAA